MCEYLKLRNVDDSYYLSIRDLHLIFSIHKNIDNNEKIQLIEINLAIQISVASGNFELIEILKNKYII